MKDGREKVGHVAAGGHKIDGSPILPKMRRLTLPFGPPTSAFAAASESGKRKDRDDEQRGTLHEHYIREIPLAGGGLGCALWDGGLVLARWVYKHGPAVFQGRSVLELGCGVGLAGIMAAHWARSVVLTDYIQDTVDNALYNAKINCGGDCPTSAINNDGDGEDSASTAAAAIGDYTWDVASRVSARVLDWDLELAAAQQQQEQQQMGQEEEETKQQQQQQQQQQLPCTVEGSPYSTVQPWVWCRTCWPDDDSCGACLPCSLRCHASHDLVPQPPAKFKCDCRKRSSSSSSSPASPSACVAVKPLSPIAPVDILLGSELTYNLLSTSSLAFVVGTHLRPGGVFYEVLSDDRDGVSQFAEQMLAMGFTVVKVPAGREFVGNFGTRNWSKQNCETYSFYTWRKPSSAGEDGDDRLPDMTA